MKILQFLFFLFRFTSFPEAFIHECSRDKSPQAMVHGRTTRSMNFKPLKYSQINSFSQMYPRTCADYRKIARTCVHTGLRCSHTNRTTISHKRVDRTKHLIISFTDRLSESKKRDCLGNLFHVPHRGQYGHG